MNYYPFNVGDYAAHTGHLEPMEDLAYRRLLDQYYLREGLLPADIEATAKLVRMRSMKADVESVLREFFDLTEHGWAHSRCDAEIEKMQDKQAKARASGLASANARSKAQQASADRALRSMQTNVQRSLPEELTDVQLPTPTPTPTPTLTPRAEDSGTPPFHPPAREPDLSGHQPTAAGVLCRAIKAAGVVDVNPGHPDLLRLIAGGIPTESFTATAAELAEKGKGKFALLLKTVEGRWNDAQAAPALAAAAAMAPGVSAVAQTANLLAEQAAAAAKARSPEAQAARLAALARLKGVAA